MIQAITYTFPNNPPEAQAFFQYLSLMLTELPSSTSDNDSVRLTASAPSASLPVTVFEQSNILFPQMDIGSDPNLNLVMGKFSINGDGSTSKPLASSAPDTPRLSIKEVYDKLHGHLVRIDHTGVNIPTALIAKEQWESFAKRVAAQSNLYNYFLPDKPWLFILPATKAEFDTDISEFPAGREPKCELVYDEYATIPAIQIDIETDLTREEVEVLFPDPYGISFEGLADYFRAVYVRREWDGLDIRFDIRFKSDKPGPWETGEWLVEDGGRIRTVV